MPHSRIPIIATIALAALLAACGSSPAKQAGATVTVTVAAETATVTVGSPSAPSVTAAPVSAPTSTVTATPSTAPASGASDQIVMTGRGYSVSGEGIGWGVVVQNKSATDDALQIQVTVNFMTGANGDILKTEAENIPVIPSGQTYYIGDDSVVDTKSDAKRLKYMDVSISTGDWQAKQYGLAKISKLRILPQDFLGGVSVAGQIENTLDQPLSQLAKIGVVVFGANGAVVCGGFSFPDADIPPGRKVSFNAQNGLDACPAKKAKRAQASIENEAASPF
jgi:hypothetical protein